MKQESNGHGKLVGSANDLKSGEFSHAARGLRHYLQVDAAWDENTECETFGMDREVARLKDCPSCAKQQASVLATMQRAEDAEYTERLAAALVKLRVSEETARQGKLENCKLSKKYSRLGNKQAEEDLYAARELVESAEKDVEVARQEVESIRDELKSKEIWYYGSEQTPPDWPHETVEKPYGEFKQPLCGPCKNYRLDYTSIFENWDYVLRGASSEAKFFNGVRDRGRPGKVLEDFIMAHEAVAADLTPEEVACLRFYTSHSFDAINSPLRDTARTVPHPLSAITMNIQNGIKKLRAIGADDASALQQTILWRGFKDMVVSEAFETDGGTELAPMSTTTDLAVAVQYASKSGQSNASLMFRIVTDNNLQRGADLSWVSMFPGEAEVLFPPLTFIQPTGKVEVLPLDGSDFELAIVEVRTTLP